MKKITMSLVLLSLSVFAQEPKNIDECVLDSTGLCKFETSEIKETVVKEKTPENFDKSKIKRKLKDGSFQEFDGNKFKIVPRTQKRLKKTKVKKAVKPVIIREKKVLKNVTHKNRVSLFVSQGPSGELECSSSRNRGNCSTESGLNLGIQGQRDFYTDEDFSLHGLIQVQTNREVSVGIGVGF